MRDFRVIAFFFAGSKNAADNSKRYNVLHYKLWLRMIARIPLHFCGSILVRLKIKIMPLEAAPG